MSFLTPVINAIGPERVAHLVTSLVKCRAQIDPVHQELLDDSVLEFIGRNPLALSTLMLDRTFPDSHPRETEVILKKAYERASGKIGRERVEQHAMEAGHFDLFGQMKAKEVGFLTRSQRAGLDRMLGLAKLHFENSTRYGVRLRTWPLLVGPSGVGKSNLVRHLAAEMGGLPVTKLTYGEWLVSGSRTEATTLQRLRAALEKHDRQILFIDELDKVHASSDAWSRALLTELFGVLDGQLGLAEGSRSGWSPELLRKLREKAFIVGAGTWQDIWRSSGASSIGFSEATRAPDIAERIRKAQVIPQELLNRFCPAWILLEPYNASDFEEISAGLKLPPGILDPISAAESGLNFRAVEAALTAHALRQVVTDEF